MYLVQQASWANLYNFRSFEVVVYVFLKTRYFSSASFVYFFILEAGYKR